MDFNQVRYFLALAETFNFTQAAHVCNVTQPALTQAIKRLETELGGKLVLRRGNNTALSPLGQELLNNFSNLESIRKLILNKADTTVERERTTLHIRLAGGLGSRLVMQKLCDYRFQHSQYAFQFHHIPTAHLIDMLSTGVLDVGFTPCTNSPPAWRFSAKTLYTERMVVGYGDALTFSPGDPVPFNRIVGLPYIDRLHCHYRDVVHRQAQFTQQSLNLAYATDRDDDAMQLVRSGTGIAIFSEYTELPHGVSTTPLMDAAFTGSVQVIVAKTTVAIQKVGCLLRALENGRWHPGEFSEAQ